MFSSPISLFVSTLSICLLITPGLAAFPWATAITRTGWNVTTDSFQVGNEPLKVIDGNTSTFWHTAYTPTVAALPHYIQFDMLRSYIVNGISYVPRQTGTNGYIGQHTITLSNDGITWTSPVSFGSFQGNAETKDIFFSNATARYLRLTAQSEAQGLGYQYSSMAEFNVYSPNPALAASTFVAPPTTQGQWGPSIVLPVVGGAAALRPDNTVVFWSAFRPDLFSGGTGLTYTATWDPTGQAVSQVTVSNTGHDMFCPGISIDVNGEIVVTGGNDNKKTSIFNGATSAWVTGAPSTLRSIFVSSLRPGCCHPGCMSQSTAVKFPSNTPS